LEVLLNPVNRASDNASCSFGPERKAAVLHMNLYGFKNSFNFNGSNMLQFMTDSESHGNLKRNTEKKLAASDAE
jgi:hypothetical protein